MTTATLPELTVKRAELSTLRMVAGNEKRISKVIDPKGQLREWVGFGWIDIRKATETDRMAYPTMVD